MKWAIKATGYSDDWDKVSYFKTENGIAVFDTPEDAADYLASIYNPEDPMLAAAVERWIRNKIIFKISRYEILDNFGDKNETIEIVPL